MQSHMPMQFVTICSQIGVAKYMTIQVGSLVFSNKGFYQDKRGWFKVVEYTGKSDARCKRIMSEAGVVIKNSKVRVSILLADLKVMTPELLEERRQAAYKAADSDFQYLLDVMHK